MVDKAEKTKTFACRTLEELDFLSNEIIFFSDDIKVIIFDGEMGAGKTTLIKSLCKILGVDDTVHSPTFSLVNEYRNKKDDTIYHFDFYRIKKQEEAMDIGIDEYLYSGNYCFIEWPSKIADLLPEKYVQVKIEVQSGNSRTIDLVKYE